jgi:hypothetical protein
MQHSFSIGRMALVLALGAILGGCAAGLPEPVGSPVADPAALAAELQRLTTPASPQQANFQWTLDEAGSRIRGRGVVRFVAPERQRLDLFGPRGETYLAAALVGEQFRVPPAVTQSFDLPSPALLWAVLGVIRPPQGAPLVSATADGDAAILRYSLPNEEQLEFRAHHADGHAALTQVERRGRRGVLETLRLEYGDQGQLVRARYRDLSAYRDLVFETEAMREVASFPDDIWRPDAASR